MAVVCGYGLACFVSCLMAVVPLMNAWSHIDEHGEPPTSSALWSKLIPFAAFIWFNDLLSNLFGAADRYMIVHFSHQDPQQATELVGQYHSSLVVPVLLIAVSTMIASVVLPYAASDWEKGDKNAVSHRFNLAAKGFGLLAMFVSLGVLTMSGLIFGWALSGKYQDGLAVLPWTLAFCTWGGLSVICRGYLLCVEKPAVASLGTLFGLVANVGLNFLLLPRFGLIGAVWATSAGNIVTLAVVFAMGARHGMALERGTIIISLFPALLLLGPPAATGCFLAILFLAISRNWLFAVEEKSELLETANRQVNKFCDPILSRFNTATSYLPRVMPACTGIDLANSSPSGPRSFRQQT